ncbi:hypothetical protein EBAPG3_014050 [Nitrosospira lacus]|uniref:Uncharacterized protein n=1 Tax=Nitrosospira lacus TaxID=1288494 RepID=A0A1W6SSK5_9PROT|nr:hypothetical protein EBAPG3_014050 [Nitrosospira lacus]
MMTKVLLVFPYSGFDKGTPREGIFWELVNKAKARDVSRRPLVILNRDTEIRGKVIALRINAVFHARGLARLYCWTSL